MLYGRDEVFAAGHLAAAGAPPLSEPQVTVLAEIVRPAFTTMPRPVDPPYDPDEILWPVPKVAHRLKCSVEQVEQLIASGKLRAVTVGKGGTSTRVPIRAIEAYERSLASRRRKAGNARQGRAEGAKPANRNAADASLPPDLRRLRVAAAQHRRWALEPDRPAATKPARDAFLARFEREVDPDGKLPSDERTRCAVQLRRSHMQLLSIKSAQARAAKKAAKHSGSSW